MDGESEEKFNKWDPTYKIFFFCFDKHFNAILTFVGKTVSIPEEWGTTMLGSFTLANFAAKTALPWPPRMFLHVAASKEH